MLLCDLLQYIKAESALTTLDFDTITQFIDLCRLLRTPIGYIQPHYIETPPAQLPVNIQEFLQVALDIPDDTIKLAWDAFKQLVWDGEVVVPEQKVAYLPTFLRFGLSHNISCKTRYYHDYYVHLNATRRTYYGSSQTYLQIATHYYVARDLVDLFISMMANAWTSATNCARIYNESLIASSFDALPPTWEYRLRMNVEDVWNAFFLHSLLTDFDERSHVLELPHDAASQATRLDEAIRLRNASISGTGQDHWNHACNLCCWIHADADGTPLHLRSVVIDGVTLGHPCCSVHNCMIPLASTQDHFCPTHRDHARICVVTNCDKPARLGAQTCTELAHSALEEYYNQQGKAMFQLKLRLERARARNESGPPSESPATVSEADVMSDVTSDMLACGGKPDAGNRQLKARFGRRWTHNDELCTASCGIILGCTTFYGSEAPNGVRHFLMRTFPTKRALPGVIWHDNNCQIVRMLRNDVDPYLASYFDNCALLVDVFHFKSKHKEQDVDCGNNCNPYIWPELRTDDGKWRFNSSAAEQANAWYGGFQAIVREMHADRYNFFLDEMIKYRNKFTFRKLQTDGHAPFNIPRKCLL
ncbi:hypothetical protein QCA50_007309 [Cerrena zonata]|uniref:CxC6 like cysteine cluster associated with KDZ domain-containing protein n=1 Tax=Cerrena zonata TaxID=2478898 RepID=A0AAW0GHY7_9APHY